MNRSFILLLLGTFFLSANLYSQKTSLKEVKGLFLQIPSHLEKLQMVDVPLLYDNGILFTFYGDKGDQVYLSGAFNEWREEILMENNSKGIFYHFLTMPLKKGEYTYRFKVNGIWVNDQEQPFFKIDIHNQRVSYFRLPQDVIFKITMNPEPIEGRKYRFYLKDEGYKEVSLITEENNWEPGFTPLTLNNGYWYVDYSWGAKKLLYAFWVDGEKKLDPHSLSRTVTSFNLPVNYYIPNFFSN